MRRRYVLPAAAVAACLTSVVGTVAITGGASAPAAAAAVRVSTATVVLTNLATTVLTGGTLGYAPGRPITNKLTGTYTALPAEGRTITAGQVLYRVDNQPVTAMTGRTPAWRSIQPGMTPGPDIIELQASLIALGYATGLFSVPTGQYDLATDDAVQRWQAAADVAVTGQITLGQIVFLPGAIRVGALNVAPGQAASPGQAPFAVTTAIRTVTVPVGPTLPPATVGERVSIVLPSLARTPGRVSAISQVAAAPGSRSRSSGGSTELTVTPDRPGATGTGSGVPVEISLTVQSVRHVLAVPVAALLALAGGGYGLEIVTARRAHRLVGVRTGIFAGGLVQVTGAHLVPGVKVVVAQ